MMRSLGLPELVFLFALIVLVVMLTRARERRRPYTDPQAQASGVRYCRHCGNSLMQPPEAPFCPFCGRRVA